MTLLMKFTGIGLPVGTTDGTINPGIGGRGDLGWPINGGAFPRPDAGSEGPGFGHAFSFVNVGVGRKLDATEPTADFCPPYFPFAVKPCWQSWRMTPTPWLQPPARTVYSISFMWTHLLGDTFGFDQPYEFFRVMDESATNGPLPPVAVRRWGLQYQGQVFLDFGGAEPRKLLITNQSGGGLAGYTSWQAPLNVPVKYQIQVDSAQNPSVTVRAYTESATNNENWVLRATLTANPASVAARQVAWGAPFAEQGDRRFATTAGNLVGAQLTTPMVWDTYNADGNFVGTAAWSTYQYPQVTAVLKDENGDTQPLTIYGLKNLDNSITDLGRALNYPLRNGLRASRRVKPPAMDGDGGYQVYGSDVDAEATNQTLQMFYPTTPMPPGGYPLFVWGNTQYFISGTWESLITTNYEMLHNLVARGYAVCSFGVTNGNLTSPINLFPKIVVQAKECIKWVKTYRSVASGGKINPNKIFVGGYSAGGWIAGMAGITKGLVSANGTNFTLAGNGKTGPDPSVAGIVMFNSPIDLTATRFYDPTHPGFSTANLFYTGSIHAVTATLFGASPDADPDISKLDIPQYIIENHANIPPIRYQSGTNDSVIPRFNGEALQTACATVSHPFSIRWHTGGIHTEGGYNFNPGFLDWMDSVLDGSYP